MTYCKGSTRFGSSLPENVKELASEMSCILKKLDDEVQKKKTVVSVNLCCALFSLLDFLALAAGTDRLSQNVSMELPLYAG